MRWPKRIAVHLDPDAGCFGRDGGMCAHHIAKGDLVFDDERVYVLLAAPKPRKRKKAKR